MNPNLNLNLNKLTNKKVKLTYLCKKSSEESTLRLDKAFDILFEYVFEKIDDSKNTKSR